MYNYVTNAYSMDTEKHWNPTSGSNTSIVNIYGIVYGHW